MRIRITASIVTLALAAGVFAASAAPASAAGSGSGVPVWAADFMAGAATPSRARAVAQAKHFDVIAALKGTYADHVDAMKAANPDLVLFVYMNGVMAQAGEGSAFHDSWYLRDGRGNKIRTHGWGNYLMDPTKTGWLDATVHRCETFLADSGYDGCFLDVLGAAPLSPAYVTGLPIDPSTGKVWGKRAWLAATTKLADAVRDAISPAPVFGNGLASGPAYFSKVSPRTLLGGLDGGMAESFVRDAYAPSGSNRSAAQWRQDANLLRDVASRGDVGLAVTKVWSKTSLRQTRAIQRYAMATFLLGYRPGMSYFSFRDDHGLTRWRSVWGRSIGSPTGAYRKVGDSYVREFTGGVVVVNPTGSKDHVHLGGRYRRAGTTVSRVTVRAHRASILLEA
jgi:hypothetical protein